MQFLSLSTEVALTRPSPLCSYVRQFGDLDQSLEVQHISGFVEERLKAVGQRATNYFIKMHKIQPVSYRLSYVLCYIF